MRRAAKRDENEQEVVQALRKMHKLVDFISGTDIPDLLVITPGSDVPVFVCHNLDEAIAIANMNLPIAMIEMKMPGKKLRPGQKKWHDKAKNCKENRQL